MILSCRFAKAHGRVPDMAAIVDAIATYERSLITPGSQFDRWLLGEISSVTAAELSGYRLFDSVIAFLNTLTDSYRGQPIQAPSRAGRAPR